MTGTDVHDLNEIDESEEHDGFIAVVGMAGRFPGARDLDDFWSGLAAGRESVTRFATDEATGRTPAYAVVDGADEFDAAFFGYSPREALMLDPQHRVFMECAWEALEHAGCDPTTYQGAIGVYGGSGDTGHFATLRDNRAQLGGVSDWHLRMASGADFLTSRVSYKLGLSGPAVTVQTACSTSLVAVHVASQALLAGDCDLALAGGVTVRVPHPLDEGDEGIVAADGYCRAFDAAASGTIAGDGAGIVALKRLSDALADGDHVHAVLRGSAVNNDGAAKIGFTAPSVEGQAAAVRAAYQVAGVDPAGIGYVEAHGTGTAMGDPIEVRALSKAFADGTDAVGFSMLGSVKTNIGHTDAAAGVIGLIKVVLSLQHELIPGTVNFTAPNPQLDLDLSPFMISASSRPWPRTGTPRLAGVNSLGIGGTNAHVVVEEAPASLRSEPGRANQLLPLSARTPAALQEAARRLAAHVGTSDDSLEDVAWTLQTGRRAFPHRAFVVAGDRDDAVRALTAVGSASVDATRGPDGPTSVAFLFPGQGGQHVEMAHELYVQEPVFRSELDACAELARRSTGLDLRDVLYAGTVGAAERLSDMRVSQPALFAVEYALARLWQSWGITPAAVLGHSLGAYAAATISGVLSLADAITLVVGRGAMLASLPAGAMLAVRLSEAELLPRLGARSSIAAINGPQQCVVTGPAAEVAQLHERLEADGIEARLLHISAAAHSVLVDAVADDFERLAAQMELGSPEIPWISDHTGREVTAAEASDPAYWRAHLRHTVRFSDAMETLLGRSDAHVLEVGPGRTLATLARLHPAYDGRLVVVSLPHAADTTDDASVVLTAAGRLWQSGVAIDWAAVHAGETRRRVPLPTYPFERQRFRLEPARPAEPTAAPAPAPPPNAEPVNTQVAFERPDLDQEYVLAATDTERAVAAVFGEVLGLRDVGVFDDFFDLGGDSLVATRLVAIVRDALGADLSVRALFRAPTVSQLAELIDSEGEAA